MISNYPSKQVRTSLKEVYKHIFGSQTANASKKLSISLRKHEQLSNDAPEIFATTEIIRNVS